MRVSSAPAPPARRDLKIPGAMKRRSTSHRIAWLASVLVGHTTAIGKRVIVLGGGNTAMDCCRSAKRLGGEDVKVIVRSPFDERRKASPWRKEDAAHENIPILDCLVPKAFLHDNGTLTGMRFEKVRAQRDLNDGRRQTPARVYRRAAAGFRTATSADRGRPGERVPVDRARCRRHVRRIGHAALNEINLQPSEPRVFFGGGRGAGAEEHHLGGCAGHAAAISIDKFLHGERLMQRRRPA